MFDNILEVVSNVWIWTWESGSALVCRRCQPFPFFGGEGEWVWHTAIRAEIHPEARGKHAIKFHVAVTFIRVYHYSASLAIGYGWLTCRITVGTNKNDCHVEFHSAVFPRFRVNLKTDCPMAVCQTLSP